MNKRNNYSGKGFVPVKVNGTEKGKSFNRTSDAAKLREARRYVQHRKSGSVELVFETKE